MSEHLVVAFRALEPRPEAEEYLVGMRALSEQAAAMGGRILSWGASVCAFEFDPDSSVDAIELAISVALDSIPGLRFGTGISEGTLYRTQDATVGMPLAWGPPLVRAIALCRTAKSGEVLVDPIVAAVKRAEVLTTGARSGLHGKQRLRALLLDIRHPFRSALSESVGSLQEPDFVGRSELGEMLVAAGSVAVLRADPGMGGSRFLEELGRALEPARALTIGPSPLGEPLGALRRALLRALTLGQAPLAFSEEVGQSLDGLLAGEGLDVESAAELLATWLTPDSPHDPSGALLLDDADLIDQDTIEVIAQAVRFGADPFRIVARLRASGLLPPALAALTTGADVRLGPLSVTDAAAVADASLRGEVDTRTAERWAGRGGGAPLAIVESLYAALEGGDLIWEGGVVTARLSRPSAVAPNSAKYWIKKRLKHLDADPRLLVTALSIFGGEAEIRDVQELVQVRIDAPFELGAARAVLESAGWVKKVKPDMLALRSATHRDALLSTLESADFAAWHQAASVVLERRSRPLAAASAAVHAIHAGDMAHATELAKQVAASAEAVGLERVAEAFRGFSETGEIEPLVDRRLFVDQLSQARRLTTLAPGPPPVDDDAEEEANDDELSPESVVLLDDEPVSVPPESASVPTVGDAVADSVPPPPLLASVPPPARSSAHAVDASADDASDLVEDLDLDEDVVPLSDAAPEGVSQMERSAGDGDARHSVDAEPESAVTESHGAVVALRAGNAEAVEEIAARLRVDADRSGLADRLSAMASLARGETGEALRRLRRAAEAAARDRSPDQCRTKLALAVGLARAERLDEALLEALTALARAREHQDERGEVATLRFIVQLNERAGHGTLVERWQAVLP